MSMKYFVMLSWIFAFRKVWAASDEGYNDVDVGVDDVIGEKEEEKEGGRRNKEEKERRRRNKEEKEEEENPPSMIS